MEKSIFDPVDLHHIHLKNRVLRSATWEALAKPDGSPSAEQILIYEELSKGDIGGIITGFTSVADDDNYFGGMARLSNDTLIQPWSQVADVVHRYGCPVIVQLALGEFIQDGDICEPDQCSVDQIHSLVDMFGDAAKRAKEAGFDGVQIHAAHGFYLSRFISPAHNHRIDVYGNNTTGRAKILLDILQDIQKKAPGIHVTMKINGNDFMFNGLEPSASAVICAIMEKAGIDSIEVSGNGTSVAGIHPGREEGYFLPFAKEIQKACNVPLILVGGHRSIEHMNDVINKEGIEMLSISRPLVREADLIKRWKNGDTSPAQCVSCNMCYQTPGHRCVFVLKA